MYVLLHYFQGCFFFSMLLSFYFIFFCCCWKIFWPWRSLKLMAGERKAAAAWPNISLFWKGPLLVVVLGRTTLWEQKEVWTKRTHDSHTHPLKNDVRRGGLHIKAVTIKVHPVLVGHTSSGRWLLFFWSAAGAGQLKSLRVEKVITQWSRRHYLQSNIYLKG